MTSRDKTRDGERWHQGQAVVMVVIMMLMLVVVRVTCICRSLFLFISSWMKFLIMFVNPMLGSCSPS